MLLIVVIFIPISLNGPIHASKIGRSAAMACRYTPRILPLPLSTLKYAASFFCSYVG